MNISKKEKEVKKEVKIKQSIFDLSFGVLTATPEDSNHILVIDYDSKLYKSLLQSIFIQGTNIFTSRYEHISDESLFYIFNTYDIRGVVLSGSSTFNPTKDYFPVINSSLLQCGLPILAICYSAECVAYLEGCNIVSLPGESREEGPQKFIPSNSSRLFKGLDIDNIHVFMFHRYMSEDIPNGYTKLGSTESCEYAAFQKDNLICLQFHPEHPRSLAGKFIMKNFIEMCGVQSCFF